MNMYLLIVTSPSLEITVVWIFLCDTDNYDSFRDLIIWKKLKILCVPSIYVKNKHHSCFSLWYFCAKFDKINGWLPTPFPLNRPNMLRNTKISIRWPLTLDGNIFNEISSIFCSLCILFSLTKKFTLNLKLTLILTFLVASAVHAWKKPVGIYYFIARIMQYNIPSQIMY